MNVLGGRTGGDIDGLARRIIVDVDAVERNENPEAVQLLQGAHIEVPSAPHRDLPFGGGFHELRGLEEVDLTEREGKTAGVPESSVTWRQSCAGPRE